MKQSEIVKIMLAELGIKDASEINKVLKAKDAPAIRFRIAGKKIGHLGFTGLIKSVEAAGLKVFDVNKVTLLKYSDIEKFEKAKPKVPRPVQPKKEIVPEKKTARRGPIEVGAFTAENEDDESEGQDQEDTKTVSRRKPAGKQGSRFIPAKPGKL